MQINIAAGQVLSAGIIAMNLLFGMKDSKESDTNPFG
jgi:hypothetical protein